jgi:hypothetical protein
MVQAVGAAAVDVRRVEVVGYDAADMAIFERTAFWRDLLAGWTPWWTQPEVARRCRLARVDYRLINRHGRVLRVLSDEVDGRTGRPRTRILRAMSIAERAAAWRAARLSVTAPSRTGSSRADA